MAKKIKCKQCSEYFEKPTEENKIEKINIWLTNFCSKSCRLEYTRAINRKAKDKVKVRKTKAKDKKANSPTILKKKLWKIVSEYIRRRDSNSEWIWKCCSCDIKKHWKELQAWHYIPSWSSSYHRYEEKNIHIQCYGCNCWKGWNLIEYRPFMIEKYWIAYVDWLFETRNRMCDLWSNSLNDLIIFYEAKLESLETNLN